MFGLQNSEDYQPVAWIGKYPIHMTTLLVIVHVVTMLITVIATAVGHGAWISESLVYSSSAVFHRFAFWQFCTYAFVHPPNLLFWFLVEMYLLFSFGREVEKFIGRRAFLSLYLLLLFLPPCLLTAIGLFVPSTLAGSGILNFCVFLAFATIYPNVRLMFGLVVKWVAAALLAVYTLQVIAFNDWTGMLVLWASAALAFGGIRRLRGEPILEGLPLLSRSEDPDTTKEPSRRKFPGVKSVKRSREPATSDQVDAILDKISKQGIASLSAKERATLERARKTLMSKDRRD